MIVISITPSATIFDIQRYAIHDGPGIRTLVFFKGCPLRCWWCCNPESQKAGPQLALFPQNCIMCGQCIEACPEGAVSDQDGLLLTEKTRCIECGRCTIKCYANARKMIGRKMDVEEVFEEIKKDELFYKNSGGGVTLSGGEPLVWPDFASSLLEKCKNAGINTAVETCGYSRWTNITRLLDFVDLFLYDLKIMNEDEHKKYTGVSNKPILENLERLNEYDNSNTIIVRIPLIRGINDSTLHMHNLCSYVKSLKRIKEVHLLPYHRLGESKYRALGRTYFLTEINPPAKEKIETLKELFIKEGLRCRVLHQ